MPQDDLDYIPSIIPTRDGPQRRTDDRRSSRGKPVPERRQPRQPPPPGTGTGAGAAVWVFLLLALFAAAGACAWAWQLQAQLRAADLQLEDYAGRIGDLEARLSDTDEGMTQNATLQAAKIRELDSEVRKLWDNVWKRTSERLDKLEASNASQGKSLSGLTASMTRAQASLDKTGADVASLKSVAGDLSRLMASAKANQAEVERVADSLNRIDLELAKLGKRVQGNEEWVNSINAFRRQVNASLADLQNSVRALQAPPP